MYFLYSYLELLFFSPFVLCSRHEDLCNSGVNEGTVYAQRGHFNSSIFLFLFSGTQKFWWSLLYSRYIRIIRAICQFNCACGLELREKKMDPNFAATNESRVLFLSFAYHCPKSGEVRSSLATESASLLIPSRIFKRGLWVKVYTRKILTLISRIKLESNFFFLSRSNYRLLKFRRRKKGSFDGGLF